jgi:hypothetical protein
MVLLSNAKLVNYNSNTYAVLSINFKGTKIPIVLDKDAYEFIKREERHFYFTDNLNLATKVNIGTSSKPKMVDIYLHEIVMKLKKASSKISSIIHINKINLDNRYVNLIFDTPKKDCTKNLQKKQRIIDLSKYGIDVQKIPSFVWYLNEDDTHGNRFIVELGPIKWKSTSSMCLSLRYKLEETKKYLRLNKDKYPSLFKDYSMNGDLNNNGEILKKEFYDIIQLAGFNYKYQPTYKTDDFLKEDLSGLSDIEVELLKQFNLNTTETTNQRLKLLLKIK